MSLDNGQRLATSVVFVLIYSSCLTSVVGYVNLAVWICQGQSFTISCANPVHVLHLKSLTIFAQTDANKINDVATLCEPKIASQCHRTVKLDMGNELNFIDTGLDDEYEYYAKTLLADCYAKNRCKLEVPEWDSLIGENTRCPQNGTNYLQKILLTGRCLAPTVNMGTATYPPSTTGKTTPSTPTQPVKLGVTLRYLQPSLSDVEKIILGACVGLAILLLIGVCVLLYCCDWYGKKRRNTLHDTLGGPTANLGAIYDDEDDMRDIWDAGNTDAILEYTGAKPAEYIDHNTINTKFTDSNQSPRSVPMNMDYYMVPVPVPSPNYESEENIELELRMAADRYYEDELSTNSVYSY